MKKVFNFVLSIIKYVLIVGCLPISIILLVHEYLVFKKYDFILKKVINSNNEFFTYLDKLEFTPDWLGRLYTVQPIPSAFRDFSDDELYDITMRSLLPMTKLIEKNVLIDIVSVIIKRISNETYFVIMTPKNDPTLMKYLKLTIISTIITIIAGITLFLFL